MTALFVLVISDSRIPSRDYIAYVLTNYSARPALVLEAYLVPSSPSPLDTSKSFTSNPSPQAPSLTIRILSSYFCSRYTLLYLSVSTLCPAFRFAPPCPPTYLLADLNICISTASSLSSYLDHPIISTHPNLSTTYHPIRPFTSSHTTHVRTSSYLSIHHAHPPTYSDTLLSSSSDQFNASTAQLIAKIACLPAGYSP